MNHPAEIAALKKRVAELEAKANPAPQPDPPLVFGQVTMGDHPRSALSRFQGDGAAQEGAESYEARMAARRASEDRCVTAEKAERERLGGMYVDPCGILRHPNGRQATVADGEQQQKVQEIVTRQFGKEYPDE